MSSTNVYEYRAIASASAPSHSVAEADFSPIRFRAYIAMRGAEHDLLVQGDCGLPDESVLHAECVFASPERSTEQYVLRDVSMTVKAGRFAGLLFRFPGAPRPGAYIVRVKFLPEQQPVDLPAIAAGLDEWCVAAEIVIDPPSSDGPIRKKRLAWEIGYLAAELAHIEDQLDMATRLLDQARSDAQRDAWRLEVLLLHDLATLYGRRLADRERELDNV